METLETLVTLVTLMAVEVVVAVTSIACSIHNWRLVLAVVVLPITVIIIIIMVTLQSHPLGAPIISAVLGTAATVVHTRHSPPRNIP